jgi:hypothetical protein
MPISNPNGPKGALEKREPTAAEVQAIEALCTQRGVFRLLASVIVTGVARSVGFQAPPQAFDVWLSEYAKVLMRPESFREREGFVLLAECSERRADAVLVSLYAFGAHGKLQETGNDRCAAEFKSARKLRKLAISCQQKMAPHIVRLAGAPGLWPEDARALNQTLQTLKEIVNEPSGKSIRKQTHRGLDWLLLHCIAYLNGVQGRSPLWIDPVGGTVRTVTYLLFGAPGKLNVSDSLRCATIAERASGVATPRSFDALVEIYYEKHKDVWKPIRRHTDYHLDRECES